MQRVLVRLFSDQREPGRIQASGLGALTAQYFLNLDHVVEILAATDVLDDDGPAALEGLMAAKVTDLARVILSGGVRAASAEPQLAG
ncbi:hypothetical protein ACFOOK_02695 [Micromonospora krabiensis]|uniref:Uncharacterized protein n=1 Tax=Micromonospora krabiensis TaxID=307121 RepID=A0A1C3MWN0_9ACTN|nr:hypothetical protein [Micromonospora krabiensis]SBV24733.1 hypothetical protein GA0070620_0171 [Micromonospora krabiensis]